MLRRITRHRLFVPATAGTALLAAGLLFALWKCGLNPVGLAANTARWWREEQPVVRAWAEAHPTLTPIALFLAVAILPAFVLPVSPLLALCGALLGPVGGVVVAGLGMMANAIGTYALARRCRRWIEPRVLKAGYTVPRLRGENTGMVLVPMRIIPGVPFVFQNYLLGLAGAPKRTFVGWVLAIETPCAAPYVLVGAGAMQGRSDLMILGGGLLVGVAVAAKLLSRKKSTGAPTRENTETSRDA